MHKNTCGNPVHVGSITGTNQQQLYPYSQALKQGHGYKPNTYALFRTQLSTIQNHSYEQLLTTVKLIVIPTIHSPYKKLQKLLTKKYYLYIPGAV